ncbi:MAG: RteC domain-containing protein [Bacteroidota bacterium]|nr:RteC domain-containing protein [Bacteroidota bacterium]
MKVKYLELYEQMIADMKKQRDIPELEQVEYAFKIALGYCELLRRIVKEEVFASQSEEVHFFKVIKPLFTSQIEYLTLVNQGLLFEPGKDPTALITFWEHEAKRKERFIKRHSDFVRYYQNGDTDRDLKYFLRENKEHPVGMGRRYREADLGFSTSQDYLVAKLLAQQKYYGYVLDKLQQFRN